jgi:hypothetical protein
VLTRPYNNHALAGALDTDEFVVIRDGSPSLPEVLRRYEEYGGLAVNWRLFGSSGHKTRPEVGRGRAPSRTETRVVAILWFITA